MTTESYPKLVLVDREGDQLDVTASLDTLWIEDPSEGGVWAFDAEQARKLRDACNAFLLSQGES